MARDLYMGDRFAGLAARHENFRFTPVLSEPPARTQHRTGFVHEAVATDHADVTGFQAYLAGPPVMVEAATALLQIGRAQSELQYLMRISYAVLCFKKKKKKHNDS